MTQKSEIEINENRGMICTECDSWAMNKMIQKRCENCSERSDCYLKRIAEAVHDVFD